ncbi:MAG TPA: gamma-glutamylcyclotransferase family protein [Longimicrobiales bacterium]|nr:gamma-glutamylcyclotransferase family protein [Longimicrobiales bacterium]
MTRSTPRTRETTEPGFHLFVYGTLRSDVSGGAPDLLASCERLGTATVQGTLYDAGDYPALMLAGHTPIQGEIWRCPAELLPALDRYESIGEGLFRRMATRVDGIACWVYVAGPALSKRLSLENRLSDGRWPR